MSIEGVVKQWCCVGLMDHTGLLNGPVVDQVFPEVVKMDCRRKEHNGNVSNTILCCSCILNLELAQPSRADSSVARVFESLSLSCQCLTLTRIPAPWLHTVIREQSLRDIHMHLTVNKQNASHP